MLAVQGRYSFWSTCHRENNVTPGFKGILRNQQNERFILNEENQRVRHCITHVLARRHPRRASRA